MSLHVVTANRLLDGLVVYWAGTGCWSEDLQAAEAIEDKADLARVKSLAECDIAAQVVVGVYDFPVHVEAGELRARSTRELIRARRGPSVLPSVADEFRGSFGDPSAAGA